MAWSTFWGRCALKSACDVTTSISYHSSQCIQSSHTHWRVFTALSGLPPKWDMIIDKALYIYINPKGRDGIVLADDASTHANNPHRDLNEKPASHSSTMHRPICHRNCLHVLLDKAPF